MTLIWHPTPVVLKWSPRTMDIKITCEFVKMYAPGPNPKYWNLTF